METRQAAVSLVRILAMGLMLPGLILGAWLALNWVAVNALVQNGLLGSNVAVLAAVALNAVVIVLIVFEIRRQSRRLLFPQTINSLKPVLQVTPGSTKVN